jgi:hypothetical protein
MASSWDARLCVRQAHDMEQPELARVRRDGIRVDELAEANIVSTNSNTAGAGLWYGPTVGIWRP